MNSQPSKQLRILALVTTFSCAFFRNQEIECKKSSIETIQISQSSAIVVGITAIASFQDDYAAL